MKISEYEKFDLVMGKLITVSHSEIKAKLEAAKAAKLSKKKGSKPRRGDTISGHDRTT